MKQMQVIFKIIENMVKLYLKNQKKLLKNLFLMIENMKRINQDQDFIILRDIVELLLLYQKRIYLKAKMFKKMQLRNRL